jgi:hypothetical protein
MKQDGWTGMMDGDVSHSSELKLNGYEPCPFNSFSVSFIFILISMSHSVLVFI